LHSSLKSTRLSYRHQRITSCKSQQTPSVMICCRQGSFAALISAVMLSLMFVMSLANASDVTMDANQQLLTGRSPMLARLGKEEDSKPSFQVEIKRALRLMRLGKRDPEKRALRLMRLGKRNSENHVYRLMRLIKRDEEKRALRLMRLGKRDPEKRALRLMRLGKRDEEKRALRLMRLGKRDEEKRAVRLMRLGKREDPEDIEKRALRLMRLGKRSEAKQFDDFITEQKRGLRLMRLGKRAPMNEEHNSFSPWDSAM